MCKNCYNPDYQAAEYNLDEYYPCPSYEGYSRYDMINSFLDGMRYAQNKKV